ncbi:hypothetical protein H0H93_004820, partial [Arthromyces matolae]
MRIEVQAHGQKWYMKANHPVEAARWATALRRSVEWARREEGEASSASVSGNASIRPGNRDDRRLSAESIESMAKSMRSKAGTLLRKARIGDGSGGSGSSSFVAVGGPEVVPDLGTSSKVEDKEDAADDAEDEEDEDEEGEEG